MNAPQSDSVSSSPTPKKLLGTLDVMALIIGIVIGAGIFSAPSMVAANSFSVTQMMIAWILGGAISIAGALCYAELATSHPSTGGDYHFLRLAYGDKLSFLFAWARLTVIPTGSIALLGYVFGDYATQVYSLGAYSSAWYACGMGIVLTVINMIGLRSGARTQNVLTLLEVAGVLFIIVVGLFMTPQPAAAAAAQAADPATREATKWGLILVFVMLTYGGWNEAAYVSAEVVGPNKNLPRALFWSLAIVTVTYLLVNLAFVRVLGLEGAGATDAVAADMLRALMGDQGAQIISVLIAISALTSANATILLSSRTISAFGRDEPMFAFLGRWNARHDGPSNAMVTIGVISLALVALGAVTRSGLPRCTAPVFWFFFVLTGLSLFVLRHRYPHTHR